MEIVDHDTGQCSAVTATRLSADGLAATIVLRSGETVHAVIGFHDRTTLIYERWDTTVHGPSGDFGCILLRDITRVVIP